jgi:prolipoprotein diacylglyceryltransferase
MTDHPRFELIVSRPEDAHRRHNGGRLAELIFLVVDRSALQSLGGRTQRPRRREIKALVALAFTAVCLVAGVTVTRPGNFTSHAVVGELVAEGNDWITHTKHKPQFDIVPRYLP